MQRYGGLYLSKINQVLEKLEILLAWLLPRANIFVLYGGQLRLKINY